MKGTAAVLICLAICLVLWLIPGDQEVGEGRIGDEGLVTNLDRTREPDAVGETGGVSRVLEGIREGLARPVERTALRVMGTVLDPASNPVADAAVEVRLTHGDGPVCGQARTRSGPDGRYEAVLPEWENLTEAVRSGVSLSARASGFLLHSRKWQVAELSAARLGAVEVRLDLKLRSGARLTGRVLLSDGRPCAGASVRLAIPGTGWRISRSTSAAGEYSIPVHRRGQHQVEATHPGEGLADALVLYLDPGADSSAPDLVLRGSGLIEGCAVYPDGDSAAGVELTAELDPDTDSTASRGLRRGRTSTRADGSFAFRGLAFGHYAIGYRVGDDAPDCDPDPVTCGTLDVRLTVHRKRVRVRVLDGAGAGVPGASIRYSYSLENQSSGGARTIRSTDGVTYIEGNRLATVPGVRFQVDAWTAETVRASADVPIVAEVYETRVDVVLRQPPGFGLLEIDVRGQDGAPVPEYRVSLRPARVSAHETCSFPVGPGGSPTVLRLPPGSFRLYVQPQGQDLFRYFFASEVVEVIVGETTHVLLEPQPIGRVRLVLRPAPNDTSEWLSLKKLTLEARDPEPWKSSHMSVPIFQSQSLRRSGEDTPFTHELVPMLWPGWYRLHAEFSGYRPVERSIFVRGKETAEVEIQLLP